MFLSSKGLRGQDMCHLDRIWLLHKFADRQKRQGYGASAWSAFGRSPPPERDSPPILSPGACCFNGRIHREREAGCIVSWTTVSSSSRNCSKSTSLRSVVQA